MRQHRAPLRSTLLALGLLAGLTLQAPTHAAGDLAQTAKGTIAPADISSGVIFGKNGEVVQLGAKGKPLKACVMSKRAPAKAKKTSLPECSTDAEASPQTEAPQTRDGGVPCQGYYIIWVGGVPVKIWYPSGCTPPQ
ncbi:MAG: hypothetical protein J0L85_22395 [Zoogloea sp.]|nr:hypothetical protein [Zoogloea sp.]